VCNDLRVSIHTPLALIERDGELSRLSAALSRAKDGTGQLAMIVGAPGMGKSALLRETADAARALDVEVLRARASDLERDYPFGTLLRLLEARFVRCEEPERARLLRGRAGLAATLLGDGSAALEPTEPRDEFALVHGLYWAVVNLADERPLALLIDDAQWADDLSLKFLAYLGRRLDDLPVLLVLAARRPDDDEELQRLNPLLAGAQDVLRPDALSLTAVRQLLASAQVPGPDRADLAEAAWRTTRGNPFLVQELIGALRRSPERWRDAQPEDLIGFAPEAVASSVVRRLSNLGNDAADLARACAALGDDAPIEVAVRLAGVDPAAGAVAMQRLVARGILDGTDTTTFQHPVIRAAVYDSLSPVARRALHAAAARLLYDAAAGPEQVAGHLLNGTPTREQWAHQTLHEVGRAATARGAPDVAVRFLRQAVEWSAPAQRSAALLLDLGLAEAAAGETTSLRRFEEALRQVGEGEQQARTLYILGQTLQRYGRHGEAVEVFARGTQRFARDDAWHLRFEAGLGCAANYVADGRAAAIQRLEAAATALPSGPPRSDGARTMMAALAVQRSLTSTDLEQTADLARMVVASDATGPGADDIALSQAVAALLFCDYALEAEAVAEQMTAEARRRGSGLALTEASFLQALIQHHLGRIDEARSAAEYAVSGTDGGWGATVPAPHGFLVDCLLELGELDAAERLLDSGEMEPNRPEASGLNAWFHWARGRTRMVRRNPSAALEDFLAAGRDLEPFAILNPAVLAWRSQAALAAHAAGDHDHAQALIDQRSEERRVGKECRSRWSPYH